MSDKPKPEPPAPQIHAGKVELSQAKDGAILLRFKGKAGVVEVQATAAQLERWAMRQMREGVFA